MKSRFAKFVAIAVVLTVAATTAATSALAQEGKIRVLQITGADVAPFHDWRDISDATREMLEDDARFVVTVSEEPLILDSAAALAGYDVIVFLPYAASLPDLTDTAKKNLVDFVKGGKGLYTQHLASASYKDWPEFREMCGRYWVMGTSGHNPRGVFEVKVAAADHPIATGVNDFKIFDELYSKLQGEGEVTAIVTADSDWSNATEPLVVAKTYGQGHCVHNALGHDYKAIKNPEMAKLIRNGVEWAATGNVVKK